MESRRSIIPPCPGRSLDMSLTPRSRFISDSARSPKTAARMIDAAKMNPTHHGPWSKNTVRDIAVAEPRTIEASKPSQVFLGLTPGANLCFPNTRPKRYPAESISATVVTKVRTQYAPSSGRLRSSIEKLKERGK